MSQHLHLPALIMLVVLVMVLFATGCSPPQPVGLIFLLDSSASSAKHKKDAIDNIARLSKALDPGLDSITIFRMSQAVYTLYSGPPHSPNLTSALEEYSRIQPDEYGTAYGNGLTRAIQEAQALAAKRTRPIIVVLGDGADERVAGGGNVNWDTLTKQFRSLPPDALLALLYFEPKWSDRFRNALFPGLGDRLLIMPPDLLVNNQGVRRLRGLIGR